MAALLLQQEAAFESLAHVLAFEAMQVLLASSEHVAHQAVAKVEPE